jgi:hypothetical protein
MTQALNAHMNNKAIKIFLNGKMEKYIYYSVFLKNRNKKSCVVLGTEPEPRAC